MASALLTANRHLVEALRDALMERHELVGREITDVLEAARDAHGGVAEITPQSQPQAAAGAVIDLRDPQGSAAPLG